MVTAPSGKHALVDVSPKGDGELSCDGHDADAPKARSLAKALLKPLSQSTLWLKAKPSPRGLNEETAQPEGLPALLMPCSRTVPSER